MVCSDIMGIGRKAIPIQADVSLAPDIKRMITEVEDSLGGIDILVNNAAIARPRQLEEISEEEWDEILDREPEIRLLGHASGDWRDAKTEMGPDHQSVFGRGTDGRCCRSALRCIEGRNHWTDAFLRLRIRPRRHHGECHCSCTD